MTKLTRRTALSGIAALPVLAAGAPAVAEGNPDAELFAKIARFLEITRDHEEIGAHYKAMREAVEADPACPVSDTWADSRGEVDPWHAFLGERGVWIECDRWNDSARRVEVAVRDVFRTPAQTAAGVLAKAEILRVAVGPFSRADGDHDENLLCAQWDYSGTDEKGDAVKVGEVDFLAAIVEDLTRIAGRATA